MGVEQALKTLFQNYSDVNLAEAVYFTLRDGIQQGVLSGGHKLSEMELAQTFQVSRTPVQKALIRLECDFLVKYEPKCGYVVEQMDFKNCVDYNEYSLLIYMAVAILAVRRKFSDYYLMVLKKRLREMQSVEEIPVYLALVDNFHLQIAESTHNEELIRAFKRMSTRGSIMGMLYSQKVPLEEVGFIERHNVLIAKLFDLICANALEETIVFMETEYCPHLRNLVSHWYQDVIDKK